MHSRSEKFSSEGSLSDSLFDIVCSNSDGIRVSPALLNSKFVQSASIFDLLSDPARCLNELLTTPRVGKVNVDRLKRIIFSELAKRFPSEWALAGSGFSEDLMESRACNQSNGTLESLKEFYNVWRFDTGVIQLSGKFSDGGASIFENVRERLMSGDEDICFVPVSVPDFLKTRSVFRVESQNLAQSAARSEVFNFGGEGFSFSSQSLIVMDAQRLTDLAEGANIYANLSPADRCAQLQALSRFFVSESSPRGVLVDLSKYALIPGIYIHNGPLVYQAFGGFFEVHNFELIDRFQNLVRYAAKVGMPISSWLENFGALQ